MMLAKVDQSAIATDIATSHGRRFSPTSPAVHFGEPEDENALASYTADNYSHAKDHRLQCRNILRQEASSDTSTVHDIMTWVC